MRLRGKYVGTLASGCALAAFCITGVGAQQATTPGQAEKDAQITIERERTTLQGQAGATGQTGASLPAGVTPKTGNDAMAATEAIRDVFETATNAAMEGDVNKLVEQFVDADRNRMQGADTGAEDAIEQAADRFRQSFEQRYNEDFEIDREDDVLGHLATSVGEIADPAQLSWPLDPASGKSVPKTAAPGEGQVNLEAGRDVAVVHLPASHGLPELTVSMIHEAPDFWKIDVPESVDRATLSTNLRQALDDISQNLSKMTSADDARRYANHRLMLAVYNVQHTAGQGGQGGQTEQSAPSVQPGQPGQTDM